MFLTLELIMNKSVKPEIQTSSLLHKNTLVYPQHLGYGQQIPIMALHLYDNAEPKQNVLCHYFPTHKLKGTQRKTNSLSFKILRAFSSQYIAPGLVLSLLSF